LENHKGEKEGEIRQGIFSEKPGGSKREEGGNKQLNEFKGRDARGVKGRKSGDKKQGRKRKKREGSVKSGNEAIWGKGR